jgi:hypothetical protein
MGMALVQTRRDLAQHLQAQMAVSGRGGGAAAGDAESDDDLESTGRTSLKTYLIEYLNDAGCAADLLADVGARAGFSSVPTQDADLFHLRAENAEAWCDTSLGRFWRLHSTSPVDDADALHKAIVGSSAWLDNVWLPPKYLEELPATTGAHLLTFALHHDRRPLSRHIANYSHYVSCRLWATRAAETLERMRSSEVFPQGVSIRSVKLRSHAGEEDGDYCLAEYFHDGKITVSGTSFDEHNRLMLRILEDYRALVEGFESTHAIGASHDPGGNPVVGGQTVVIDIAWTVEDLEYAVTRMFSGTAPFRLWAIPERLTETHYRARAADLHVGGVLTFDITPSAIYVQLPRGVCGNTVVRFLSSLRYHVNADAVAHTA